MHIIYFLTFDYSLQSWNKDVTLIGAITFNELVNLYNLKITLISYSSSSICLKLNLNKI